MYWWIEYNSDYSVKLVLGSIRLTIRWSRCFNHVLQYEIDSFIRNDSSQETALYKDRREANQYKTLVWLRDATDSLTVCKSLLNVISVTKPTRINMGSKLNHANTMPSISPGN